MNITLGGKISYETSSAKLSSVFLSNLDSVENEAIRDEMVGWLARLRLLEGTPFRYLVPSEEMLPNESIRFFHVDRNWLDALVDGAISVGRLGSRDSHFDALRYEELMDTLNEREGDKRPFAKNLFNAHLATDVPCPVPGCDALAGNDCTEVPEQGQSQSDGLMTRIAHQERIDDFDGPGHPVGGTVTGFLFRSSVVREWPGIEISVFNACTSGPDENGEITTDPNPWQKKYQVQVLRQQRLSDTILLNLFNGTPTHLRIKEPFEGIRIGVDTGDARPEIPGDTHPYDINLKDLQANFICTGCDNTVDTAIALRCPVCNLDENQFRVHKAQTRTSPADNSVLDIEGIYTAAHDHFVAQGDYVFQDSALVALQMLQFPYQQDFTHESRFSVADVSELSRDFETEDV
jgi:hypothetical protein